MLLEKKVLFYLLKTPILLQPIRADTLIKKYFLLEQLRSNILSRPFTVSKTSLETLKNMFKQHPNTFHLAIVLNFASRIKRISANLVTSIPPEPKLLMISEGREINQFA